ncbi:uncharacterized protein [Amphiura filiformis]|uniref:uncharacterized protein n=1 Tax=Amphiura filiformis TaxID=82378 RepID=UPI003B224B1B
MGTASSSSSGFQPNYGDFYLSSAHFDIDARYDVIVIGSGYGGSIAASRAARAGKKVCVLEKGREWRPGDFPETELNSAEEVQMTFHGNKTIGDPTNLFDVVISPDVAVLQGCGLGGTSLINANVALDCDPRVFQDEVWPKTLREDLETMNNTDKKRALDMLQPTVYPEHFPELPKMSRMAKAAAHIADIESLDATKIFKRTPLLVNFNDKQQNSAGIPQPACISCGNCCSGCNTGAKNTLNMNYLPDAKAHGAKILHRYLCFLTVEVRSVVKDPVSDGWRVHYIHHLRKQKSFKVKEQIVRAKVVILGAGALGSTDILLKSQVLGLELSPNLGKRFTTNGDAIGVSYNGESVVRHVGKPLVKIKKKPHKAPGPCVTSIIDMREQEGKDVDQCFVLEDCTPPSSTSLPYNIAIRILEAAGKDITSGDVQKTGRHVIGKGMKNTIAFLAVGHDPAAGELKLDEETDRVWVHYPNIGDSDYFERVRSTMDHATKSLKGTFIPNPYWAGLPATMRDTKGIVTGHPLGGCGMGETGASGVVNHAGQVFVGDTSEIHQGLYVLDGSVMPRSLGINPCLTISMVAERGMRLMAEERGWSIDFESSKVLDLESTRARPGIRFTERLAGQMTIGENSGTCKLILTIESEDVEQMLNEDETHQARVHGNATCDILSSCPLTVSNGYFTMFSLSEDNVQSREMTYNMNLTSAEGAVYYLKGHKLIHKDSAFEIGKKDTTRLEISVYKGENEDGDEIGNAKLQIRGGDIVKKLSTIEVTHASGKLERLKWKTKFCTFFMGHMWQIYGAFTSGSTPFDPTAPPREKRPLKLNGTEAKVYPITTEDGVELFLTRYQGASKGPVMLVHSMGVSSKIFSLDTVDTNLVEFLFAEGYDIWLLDWRASIMLQSANDKTTIDLCAEYDVPAGVKKILAVTNRKNLQILAHCAGAAITCGSILAGKLHGKVRNLIISQSGFVNVPTRLNWFKTHLKLPQILYGIGVEGLTAYTDSEQNWMGKILDQFLRALPMLPLLLTSIATIMFVIGLLSCMGFSMSTLISTALPTRLCMNCSVTEMQSC